jgi:hypothetical protein
MYFTHVQTSTCFLSVYIVFVRAFVFLSKWAVDGPVHHSQACNFVLHRRRGRTSGRLGSQVQLDVDPKSHPTRWSASLYIERSHPHLVSFSQQNRSTPIPALYRVYCRPPPLLPRRRGGPFAEGPDLLYPTYDELSLLSHPKNFTLDCA